ncbi:MAG TPA: MFS transporter [Pseudobdellovibrionaceae bacterium]|jgi:MFS family permease
MKSLFQDFRKLMSARFLFTLAVQMQAVILGWRMYDLMKDPLYLGLIGLTEAAPAIGLALYAGYLTDRSRPLRIYKGVLTISFFSALVVLVSQILESHLSTPLHSLLLYSASFLTGAARAFAQPAIFSFVPRIVARSELPRATAKMSTVMQVARIAGPAMGGLLYGYIGMTNTSWLVALLLLMGSVVLFRIKANPEPLPQSGRHTSRKQELLSGVRFVFSHPILLPAMSLDMISVLFGGVTALLPIFAKEILMIGPQGLGVLRAAPAVGASMMSFALTKIDLSRKAGPWLFTAVAGFGGCILIFGLSRNVYLSFLALALSGAFDSISMVIRSAAVQMASPDDMRGKISAVNSIFIGSSNEIGEFESGMVARLMGTVPSVIFGGTMCLLTVAVTAWWSPTLRKMDLNLIKTL